MFCHSVAFKFVIVISLSINSERDDFFFCNGLYKTAEVFCCAAGQTFLVINLGVTVAEYKHEIIIVFRKGHNVVIAELGRAYFCL